MSALATNIKFMFDTQTLSPAADSAVPLERLEARICELAGHLAAATCRFLVLLGDFDARRGWASWEMNSCAQWLSWKCQMSSGTAREHVRVARALRDLPVIRSGFAAGRLSYAKVRALTRIATPATEAGLAELAGPMTANQLERFARAHRQVTRADDAAARIRRRLTWRVEEDGSLSGTFRLPPLAGAVLLKALRAAREVEDPRVGEHEGVSAETREPRTVTSSDLADALVAVAESFLAGQVAGAQDAEVYQVVLHVGADALAGGPAPVPAAPAGVSAETPPPVPGDPADPARCHVEDGPAVSASTAQMISCTAALSWMAHGRRRGRAGAGAAPAAAQRRDPPGGPGTGRVPVPVPGVPVPPGRPAPHRALGQRRPDRPGEPGQPVPVSPQGGARPRLPDRRHRPAAARSPSTAPTAPLSRPARPCRPRKAASRTAHEAEITPETIIPPWYGERLDLDHAIYVCFANARTEEQKRADQEQAREPVFRPRRWVSDLNDTVNYFRRYYDEHPAA